MSDNISFDLHWLDSIETSNFEQKALELFRFQLEHCAIYAQYCHFINIKKENVHRLRDIPFLPISFFKSHKVLAEGLRERLLFESSGTTGMVPSKHYVARPELYEFAFRKGFQQCYGQADSYIILGLLPSYLERQHSSLVYMVNDLILKSGDKRSGFYLNEWDQLSEILKSTKDKKIFLIGVTFALLDFAEEWELDLSPHIVVETGGMKGRREEWTRMEVHDFLKKKWLLNEVHSEYGMSEMLSQAYAKQDGIFECSPTMRVMIRDENDPLSSYENGNGCINVIDLANIDSCAFIATEDLGKVYPDGRFEVRGRRDAAALRGCSLMAV